jgi:Cysteine rich repeat
MLKNFFAIGAIVLLSTTSAMAQQRAIAKQCAADVRAACGGVQPGDGRIRSCLNSHLKDLTPPCQAILVRAAAVGKACRGDVRQICADVKPGSGRIEACIQSHLTDFSSPCKDVMARAAAGRS